MELRPRLSLTERRIGALVAAGYPDAEIASRLLVSAQTVEWNVAKLTRALQVASREELVLRLAQLRADAERYR